MGGGTLSSGEICPATASSCDHCPILKLTDSSHMLCSTLMIQNIRQHPHQLMPADPHNVKDSTLPWSIEIRKVVPIQAACMTCSGLAVCRSSRVTLGPYRWGASTTCCR